MKSHHYLFLVFVLLVGYYAGTQGYLSSVTSKLQSFL